jgi:myo-inositol-1(or 4)-monophosphatase
MTDLKELSVHVCRVAKETGGFIREQLHSLKQTQVESKGLHDFVTYVDREAEERIVKELMTLLPEAGFIVEEQTISRKGAVYNWVVDPLDGTTNFIHGLPCFSVSIALIQEEEVILGIVYEIMRDECFYAWKEGGAYMNGDKIRVSEAESINDSLLATGFPYYDYSRLDQYMTLFTWCLRHSHGVRRWGSAATDLAFVACGRFEGFFEYSLSPWDVAAGSLIVTEAGGQVCDFKGKKDFLFGREIIATNPGIHKELLSRIQEVFE